MAFNNGEHRMFQNVPKMEPCDEMDLSKQQITENSNTLHCKDNNQQTKETGKKVK